jgi:hypothetical protein
MGKRSKPLKIKPGIIQDYENYFSKAFTFTNNENFKIIKEALIKQRALKKSYRCIDKETFIKNYWAPELKKSLETKFNTKIRKEWKKDKSIKNLKDYFFNWYFNEMKKGCYYCGQDNLLYVFLKKRFPGKAKSKPRRFLEIDRKNSSSSDGYKKSNSVLACYPCNNAKSNVFNEKEFIVIGKLIGLITIKQFKKNILSKSAKEIKELNLSEIVKKLGS